jgi:putative PIG3 family NAD(P)H quinone oxidoreductase
MKAIVCDGPGDASVLRSADVPEPALLPGHVRIRVAATAVNRADILQRQGRYPPPPGASEILGLECAGEVESVAHDVTAWRRGDRVMALLQGGGYAELAVAHAGSVMRVPEPLSLAEAAAMPETFLTVWLDVFEFGGLGHGGSLLVHGGGSGIGTAAIRMAKIAGATVIATAGSAEKCARCKALGADAAVCYRSEDFVAAARALTSGRGVDVVLDHVGGPYLARNLEALRPSGRLVVIGLMGGAQATLDLALLLRRHLTITGSTLRSRPFAEKAQLVTSFESRFGDALRTGALRPVIDRVLPLAAAAQAHRVVEASEHFGKVVLGVDPKLE